MQLKYNPISGNMLYNNGTGNMATCCCTVPVSCVDFDASVCCFNYTVLYTQGDATATETYQWDGFSPEWDGEFYFGSFINCDGRGAAPNAPANSWIMVLLNPFLDIQLIWSTPYLGTCPSSNPADWTYDLLDSIGIGATITSIVTTNSDNSGCPPVT